MVSASSPPARITPDVPVNFTEPPQRSTALPSVRGPGIVLIVLASFSLVGTVFALWLRSVPAGYPDPRFFFNAFYVLFARNEPAGLTIVALFSSLAAIFFFRERQAEQDKEIAWMSSPQWLCGSVALFVLLFTAFGSHFVFHDYLLTADENLADFQAKIFLHGKIQAEVPAAFLNAVRVIKPTYVEYFSATHLWNATYLPVYAAMRALFQSVNLQVLLNPFLAAVTVLALYGTTQNIWPESKTNALVAIGLLVSSSQFLLMSMTAYAMPAHLALNTTWLWLYSRPDRRAFYLAPFVGVLAIGLHQPIVHALFVLPFLFRLVFQRRWRAVLIFGGIYLAGCFIWFWWSMRYRSHDANGAVGSILKLVNPQMAIVQPMNLLLVIGWASLATPLLATMGLGRFFKVRPVLQDAILSCVLTFGFYYFFYLDQAHGWGYRYFHGALACFVLVAVAGFDQLSILAGPRRARAFVASGVIASLLIQLPLRCIQAESFVRPYARTAALVHSMPQDIVGINPRDAWYVADLIRNDPFLEQRPIVVALYNLTPPEIAALKAKGTARFITRDQLDRLGLSTNRLNPNDYARDPFKLGRGR